MLKSLWRFGIRIICFVLVCSTLLGVAEPTSKGGTFSLYVIPSAETLDWTSPASLLRTALKSKVAANSDVRHGWVKSPHSIGHVHVELKCEEHSFPVTGQTGGGKEVRGVLDGAGSLFQTFPGSLDDSEKASADIRARKFSGKMIRMDFKITEEVCKHLKGFMEEYKLRGADKKYGGQFRPRRFEGSGCTAFGLAFLEVGGLLKRSEFTPYWSRSLFVGSSRLSDLGGGGSYEYGSNLQAHDSSGFLHQWPSREEVLSRRLPITPAALRLLSWTGPLDQTRPRLRGGQPDAIPWTIFDPTLIHDSMVSLTSKEKATLFGRTWKLSKDGAAWVFATDATDAKPRSYFDSTDDLLAD